MSLLGACGFQETGAVWLNPLKHNREALADPDAQADYRIARVLRM